MSTFARTFGRFVIWVSWLERSRLLGHFIAWENESSHFILAQSIFDDRATAEPCIRKCPSGVILQSPTSNQMTKAEKRRTAKKSRYGFAVNYGIPMGQSTPKTWYEWQQCTENFRIWWMTVLCVFFYFLLYTVPLDHIAYEILTTTFHRSVQRGKTTLAIRVAVSMLPNGRNWSENV